MNTIQSLRKTGWKVGVYHGTHTFTKKPTRYTSILLTSPDGKFTKGYAQKSHKDNYNRKVGNAVALGRAMEAYNNEEFLTEREISQELSLFIRVDKEQLT